MSNQKVKNILNSIIDFKDKSDGTYNINTKELVTYPNGYQVSFVRPEAFKQLSAQDWDIITNYFCEHLDSKAHIGVYFGDAEVSFHILSYESAKDVMEKYNQQSMLDWEKKINNPDFPDSWFIMNRFFDENKVVQYDEIFNQI